MAFQEGRHSMYTMYFSGVGRHSLYIVWEGIHFVLCGKAFTCVLRNVGGHLYMYGVKAFRVERHSFVNSIVCMYLYFKL